MKDRQFLWLSSYAVAMALLEAVVVIYIRGVHTGSGPSLSPYSSRTLEIWRETATLVMLGAVGWLAGQRWPDRLAYGLFAFGLWDIWYYIWLKIFID